MTDVITAIDDHVRELDISISVEKLKSEEDVQIMEPDVNEDLDDTEIDFFFSTCNILDPDSDNQLKNATNVTKEIDLPDKECILKENKDKAKESKEKYVENLKKTNHPKYANIAKKQLILELEIGSKEQDGEKNADVSFQATYNHVVRETSNSQNYENVRTRPTRIVIHPDKFKDFDLGLKNNNGIIKESKPSESKVSEVVEDSTLNSAQEPVKNNSSNIEKTSKLRNALIQNEKKIPSIIKKTKLIKCYPSPQHKSSKSAAADKRFAHQVSLMKKNSERLRSISKKSLLEKSSQPKDKLKEQFIANNKLLKELLNKEIKCLDPNTFENAFKNNGIKTNLKKPEADINDLKLVDDTSSQNTRKEPKIYTEEKYIKSESNALESNLEIAAKEENIMASDMYIEETTVQKNVGHTFKTEENEESESIVNNLEQNNTIEGSLERILTNHTEDIQQKSQKEGDSSYKFTKMGDFKVLHDENGAIIKMEELTEADVLGNNLETDNEDETETEDIEPMDVSDENEASCNKIDEKLLAKTVVAIENCSALLENSQKYCRECERLFPTIRSLDDHRTICHPLLVVGYSQECFCCEFCDCSYYSYLQLQRHKYYKHRNKNVVLTHSKNKERNRSLYCIICRRMFFKKSSFNAHVNSTHFVNLQCEYCSKEFPLQDLLNDHKKTMHPQSDQQENLIKCPECDFVAQKLVGLRVHMTLKHGKKINIKKKIVRPSGFIQKTATFQCSVCNMHYLNYTKAKTHFRSCITKKSGWKCRVCYRMFPSYNDDHRKQHKFNSDLKTYRVDEKNLEVISECPICHVHYVNRKFFSHVGQCNGKRKENFTCCGYLLARKYFRKFHTGKHKSNFIVLKYAMLGKKKIED